MAYEFKKLSDVNVVQSMNDNVHVLAEENGEIVKIPKDATNKGLVKTINGVEPDEDGDIALIENKTWQAIEMLSMPGMLNAYGINAAEVSSYLRDNVYYHSIFYRIIMKLDGSVETRPHTHVNVIRQDDGTDDVIIYHGDDLAPIIVDVSENTITLDPDWVAPKDTPIPSASHQVLVTDDEGNAIWEERTHWAEYQQMTLLDETLIKQELFPGMYLYQTKYLPKYPIEIGAKCTVELNGTVYESTIQEYGEDGPPCLGNRYLQDPTSFEDTGEPFFFNTLTPGSIILGTFASGFTVPDTISVTGPVRNYIQIPSQYIAGIKEGTSMGSIVLSGDNNTASGEAACAEGSRTSAKGYAAHSEGAYTVAEAAYSHAEGRNTVAKSSAQHVQGRYNIEDTEGKYAHIVGNGSSTYGETTYSNAHTLDWEGNAWFAGTVKVGGTNQDDGAIVPAVKSASVGQTIAVKAVDENSKPTEWEAVDGNSGGVKTVNDVEPDESGNVTTTDYTWDYYTLKIGEPRYTGYGFAIKDSSNGSVYSIMSQTGFEITPANTGISPRASMTNNDIRFGNDTKYIKISANAGASTESSIHMNIDSNTYMNLYGNGMISVADKILKLGNNALPTIVRYVKSPEEDSDAANKAYVDSKISDTAIVINSSTEGSTKKFKITVDDSGTLTATEVTE